MPEKLFDLWRWHSGDEKPFIIYTGPYAITRNAMLTHAQQDAKAGLQPARFSGRSEQEEADSVILVHPTFGERPWAIKYYVMPAKPVLYVLFYEDNMGRESQVFSGKTAETVLALLAEVDNPADWHIYDPVGNLHYGHEFASIFA